MIVAQEAADDESAVRTFVATSGFVAHPALSPDGRFLAYAGGNPLQTRVYVRQVSGGRPTLLTDDSAAVEETTTTEESADATNVTVTATEYDFELSATPTAETESQHSTKPAKSAPLRKGEKFLDLTMPDPYTPKAPTAPGTDDYRCFLLDPELTENRFLTGTDVRPGNPEVVHHVILFQVPPDDAQRTVEYALEGFTDASRAHLRQLALEAYESQDYKEGTRAFKYCTEFEFSVALCERRFFKHRPLPMAGQLVSVEFVFHFALN